MASTDGGAAMSNAAQSSCCDPFLVYERCPRRLFPAIVETISKRRNLSHLQDLGTAFFWFSDRLEHDRAIRGFRIALHEDIAR